jgi:hypothetical protein
MAKLNSMGDTLDYATFLGGSSLDWGLGIAVDNAGNAHVTGYTWSSDFPTTVGAFDISHNDYRDAFAAKLNPMGNTLVYSTFLGGSHTEEGSGIAVDDSGNAYVTGHTTSEDFPITSEAFDTTYNGGEILGDIFVTKLDPTGSSLVYGTFLGGNDQDKGVGIAVDGFGCVYVTGFTESADFPTTSGAFDTTHNGGDDIFVVKLGIGDTAPDSTAPEGIDDLIAFLDSGAKSFWGNIYLYWTEPYDSVGVAHYVVYRSTEPYQLGDSLVMTSDTTFLDIHVVGNPYINFYYTVKAVDLAGNKSPASNQVGEFDRAWIEK